MSVSTTITVWYPKKRPPFVFNLPRSSHNNLNISPKRLDHWLLCSRTGLNMEWITEIQVHDTIRNGTDNLLSIENSTRKSHFKAKPQELLFLGQSLAFNDTTILSEKSKIYKISQKGKPEELQCVSAAQRWKTSEQKYNTLVWWVDLKFVSYTALFIW